MPVPTTLPIIDISPFLQQADDGAHSSTSVSGRSECARSIHEACSSLGLMYITGFQSIVSEQKMEEAIQVSREFFASSMEEKQLCRIRKDDGARGYQVLGENVTQSKADHHEGLDLYRPFPTPSPASYPAAPSTSPSLLRGPNQWPTSPRRFRAVLEDWVEKMQIIGEALLKATALGLGIDLESDEGKELTSSVNESFWVLRTIGYPPLPPEAPGISCGAHKDYGCYTLLHADSTKGALQVFLHDPETGSSVEAGKKGTWINADPIEGALVVNIGEMWEVWSNGLYKATLHRVVHQGSNYRVSIPFFFEPNFDALVKPLPSAIRLQQEKLRSGEETIEQREPIVYGDFLSKKVSGNFGGSPYSSTEA